MATRRGPDGSVRIAISGNNSGLPWANVFWANLTGGSTATQAGLDAWTLAFTNLWNTAWSARVSPDVSETLGKATLFQPNNQALHSVAAVSHPGTATGAQVTNTATCAVISWATNAYWRGGKPRTYIPGVVQTNVTANHQLTAGAITAYQGSADSWLTGVNALSAAGITQTQYGFVSFFSGNAARPTPLFFPILGHSVHGRLGTQRRRLGAWIP